MTKETAKESSRIADLMSMATLIIANGLRPIPPSRLVRSFESTISSTRPFT